MGNVRSTARGNDVVVDDDDKTEEEEEDKEEGDVVVPTANGVARVQRTPSICHSTLLYLEDFRKGRDVRSL